MLIGRVVLSAPREVLWFSMGQGNQGNAPEEVRTKPQESLPVLHARRLPRPAYVDYKDIGLLKKLCTNQNKIFSRKRSGSCAAFQRSSSAAVKRARFMALLPYVGE